MKFFDKIKQKNVDFGISEKNEDSQKDRKQKNSSKEAIRLFKHQTGYTDKSVPHALSILLQTTIALCLPLSLYPLGIKFGAYYYRNKNIKKMIDDSSDDPYFDTNFKKILHRKDALKHLKDENSKYPFTLEILFKSVNPDEDDYIKQIECDSSDDLISQLFYYKDFEKAKQLRKATTPKVLTVAQILASFVNLGLITSVPDAPVIIPGIREPIANVLNYKDTSKQNNLFFLSPEKPLFKTSPNEALGLRIVSEKTALIWTQIFPGNRDGRLHFNTKFTPTNPETIPKTKLFDIQNSKNLKDGLVTFGPPVNVQFNPNSRKIEALFKTSYPEDIYAAEANKNSDTLKNQIYSSLKFQIEYGDTNLDALNSRIQNNPNADQAKYAITSTETAYIQGLPYLIIKNYSESLINKDASITQGSIFKHIGLSQNLRKLVWPYQSFVLDQKHLAIPFKSNQSLVDFNKLNGQTVYKLPKHLSPNYKKSSIYDNINNNGLIIFILRADKDLQVKTQNGGRINFDDWLRKEFKDAGIPNIDISKITAVLPAQQIVFKANNKISTLEMSKRAHSIIAKLDQLEYFLPVDDKKAFLSINQDVREMLYASRLDGNLDDHVIFSGTSAIVNDPRIPALPGAIRINPGKGKQALYVDPNINGTAKAAQFTPYIFSSYLNDRNYENKDQKIADRKYVVDLLSPEALPLELLDLKTKVNKWRGQYLKSLEVFTKIKNTLDKTDLKNLNPNQEIALKKSYDLTKEDLLTQTQNISSEVGQYIMGNSSGGFDPILKEKMNAAGDDFIKLAQIVAAQIKDKDNKGQNLLTCEPASVLAQYIFMMVFNSPINQGDEVGVYALIPHGFKNVEDQSKITLDNLHQWNALVVRYGDETFDLIINDSTPSRDGNEIVITTSKISNQNDLFNFLEKNAVSIIVILTTLISLGVLVKYNMEDINQFIKSFRLKKYIENINKTKWLYTKVESEDLPNIINIIKIAFDECADWELEDINFCVGIIDWLRNIENNKLDFNDKYDQKRLSEYIKEITSPSYAKLVQNSLENYEHTHPSSKKFGEYDSKDKKLISSLFNYLSGEVFQHSFSQNDKIQLVIEELKSIENIKLANKFQLFTMFIGFQPTSETGKIQP